VARELAGLEHLGHDLTVVVRVPAQADGAAERSLSSDDSAGSELINDRLQFGAVAMWHYPATSRGCS